MQLPKQNKHLPRGLFIIFEDKDLLLVDKPPGLLSMGTEREREHTAYYALTNYVRKGAAKSRNRIFIVHRLDREASGLLIFAKTPDAKIALQENWDAVEKKYYAVVHGVPPQPSGKISSYLIENDARKVYATQNRREGKLSETEYQLLRTAGGLSLLEVTLLTGRKHQIRVHLADQKWPIAGDSKYGPKHSPFKRLALHAHLLKFPHPISGKPMAFDTGFPAYFQKLVPEA